MTINLCMQLDKLILKFMWKKNMQEYLENLKFKGEENHEGCLVLPDIKSCYEISKFNTIRNWHLNKRRSVE